MFIHFPKCTYMSVPRTYYSIVYRRYIHGTDMSVHVYARWSGFQMSLRTMRRKIRAYTDVAKRNQALGGRPSCLLQREGLVSEDLKSVGAPKPPGQKHTTLIRTGNLSLTKRNALTIEPRLQTGHNVVRNIVVYEVEMQKRKLQPRKHVGECCCYSPTLALGSAMEIWLWVINEMCLQRLNLSSTQDSVSNHDLALLQQAMNAEGICSPRE